MQFKLWLVGAFAVLLAACNPIANADEAEQQIANWQKLYNEGNADGLYASTGAGFREVASKEQIEDLLTIFSARLGRIESSERSGINVSTKNGLTETVITMETTFEQAVAAEIFTFHGHGEDMEIVGWQVNSDRLMVTPEDLARNIEAEQAEAAAAD